MISISCTEPLPRTLYLPTINTCIDLEHNFAHIKTLCMEGVVMQKNHCVQSGKVGSIWLYGVHVSCKPSLQWYMCLDNTIMLSILTIIMMTIGTTKAAITPLLVDSQQLLLDKVSSSLSLLTIVGLLVH